MAEPEVWVFVGDDLGGRVPYALLAASGFRHLPFDEMVERMVAEAERKAPWTWSGQWRAEVRADFKVLLHAAIGEGT